MALLRQIVIPVKTGINYICRLPDLKNEGIPVQIQFQGKVKKRVRTKYWNN
jgi:hypothetical protein